eukprot:358881-Chlamydomonas_euryale.AAC.2
MGGGGMGGKQMVWLAVAAPRRRCAPVLGAVLGAVPGAVLGAHHSRQRAVTFGVPLLAQPSVHNSHWHTVAIGALIPVHALLLSNEAGF